MNPLFSIITVLLILALLFVLFIPEKGIIALLKNSKKNKEKILIEDTLKFLFDNEYKNQASPLHAIAGSLNLSIDDVTELIPKMESLGLISASDRNNIILSEEGRHYALRVIRIHRIWERYLADETSFEEKEWHKQADKYEHKMSLKDADKLASKIGNPVRDPHGDPIPSPSGIIPDLEGIPMGELKAGQVARITHVEDDTKTIYAQLLAMGLYPGMEIRIIDNSSDKIVFECNGEERILAPIFAAEVSVKLRSSQKLKQSSNRVLSSLEKGEKALVSSISPACRKLQKRRLMDLGIVPGTEIEVALESAGKNPRAYRILNTLIALRKKHASFIFIEPISS